MKIVVTGVKGQLGHDVVNELIARGYKDTQGIDIEDVDITNLQAVKEYFKHNQPKVIIHCAAYTAVDRAEENEKYCELVNVQGTKNLVEIAKKNHSKFVYISTDYVFDGEKKGEYEIDDIPNPQSVYGKTKYMGELETRKIPNHFIIRISWVFGKQGSNFVKTMLALGRDRESLSVVSDQIGSPTYTLDLSRLIVDFIETDEYGTYHATNEGSCSWYEFSKEIFKQAKINITVYPISSREFPAKAKRPQNSLLSKKSLSEKGFKKLPSWKDALHRYLEEIEEI